MSAPPGPLLELHGVSMRFRSVPVLEDVDFEVNPGEIVGLTGPNGSGKSTILRIAAGLQRPSGGRVVVEGHDLTADWGSMPPDIGILLDPPGVLPHLTGVQNLQLLASLRRRITDDRVRDVMRSVDLDPDLRTRVGAYSLGMRQRLGWAQALMEQPALLLLDEPTNALDVESVEHVSSLLESERRRGAGAVLVSHNLGEVQRLCDRVFRLERGRLVRVAVDAATTPTPGFR